MGLFLGEFLGQKFHILEKTSMFIAFMIKF